MTNHIAVIDDLLTSIPQPLIIDNNDCAIEIRRTKKDKYKWSANIRSSNGQSLKQIADTPQEAVYMLVQALKNKELM